MTALRRLAADVTPLRISAGYRRLWAGQSVSQMGTQMTAVAVPIQVYAMTHSALDVGLVGVAGLAGLAGFGLYGGSIADARDRRRLAMLTSTVLGLLSALLAAQAAARLASLPLLYLVVMVQAAVAGVDNPARSAMIPRLLPDRQLPAAYALSQISFNAAMTVGPLAAGVLIASVGLFPAYLIDAVSFGAAFYAVARLPAMPPTRAGVRAGWAAVGEGLRYVRARPVVLTAFVVDVIAMVFGMPRALFPAIAATFYHGGAAVTGVLYAAPAAGALLGALVSGPLRHVRRQGLAVLAAVSVWGAAIAAFGFVRVLWLGVLLLGVAGAADMVSAVFRNTIVQLNTPDELRGRLSGLYTVVVAGGPRLGDAEAGGVAAALGIAGSVISGGLACLVGVAVLAAAVPAFGRYDAASRRSASAATVRSATKPA